MLDYAEICKKLQNVRICAENNKLCGNVRKTVNCAIPHPSHLIGASGAPCDKFHNETLCFRDNVVCAEIMWHSKTLENHSTKQRKTCQ